MSWFNKVNSKGSIVGSVPHLLKHLVLDGQVVTQDGVLPLKGLNPVWFLDDWFMFIGEDEKSLWISNGRIFKEYWESEFKLNTLVCDGRGNWGVWSADNRESTMAVSTVLYRSIHKVVAVSADKFWTITDRDVLTELNTTNHVTTILDMKVAVCDKGQIWNTYTFCPSGRAYLPDGPHIRPTQVGDYGLAHQMCALEFPIGQRWALVLQGGGTSNKDNLVLYPFGSPMGYKLVSEGDVLYPHAEWLPNTQVIRVVANNSKGETLQWDVDLLKERVNITQGYTEPEPQPDPSLQAPGVTIVNYDPILTGSNSWELNWHDRNNKGFSGRVEFINGSVHVTFRNPVNWNRSGQPRKVVIK